MTITDSNENAFVISSLSSQIPDYAFIGNNDIATEGVWRLPSGELQTYANWANGEPNDGNSTKNEDVAAIYFSVQDFGTVGVWNDVRIDGYGNISKGISEIPLNLSITTSSAPTEGAGVFTTSINLSAGTEASGNLAEGAEIYWSISGITADDLESGELEGSGVITDGVLEIEHSLVEDNDSGESFDVSVFSDADRTQQIGEIQEFSIADETPAPALRGNSIYSLIFKDHPRSENPRADSSLAWWSWSNSDQNTYRDQLFSLSDEYGGSIATINSQQEYDFLEFYFKDQVSFSAWVYLPGEVLGVANFRKSDYSEWGEASDYQEWFPADSFSGYAPEFAVVETPLNLSITTSIAPTEGAGVFTTSINLSAGSEASGNLAEGAEVYWTVSGITADDLASGALSGSGVITDGKLSIDHSLVNDADSGETFNVSVFSDVENTQQIGATAEFLIQEENNTPQVPTGPVIRGNSLYLVVPGPSQVLASDQSRNLGGELITVNDVGESTFISQSEIVQRASTWGLWIGLTIRDGQLKWYSGDSADYLDWSPGEPSGDGGGLNADIHLWTGNSGQPAGQWNDVPQGWNTPVDQTGDIDWLPGIAEIPLNLSITTSTTPTEGAGVFTTSINLSAGTEASGNLAEGAEVYWTVSGITEDDLESGELEGSGVIANGVLEIEHSLVEDYDSGESFDVSVFSDADRTQQIGATEVFEVKDTIRSIGPSGESLTLSGTAYNEPWQYVVIEDSPSLSISGEYTVSSWVYRSNAGGDWRNLYDIPNAHLLEFSPGGRIRWRSENNNIDFRAGDPEIPEGEWHHVAATMVQNGSEYSASVYVDGQLATNTNDNNSNGVRDSNENLYLGILWSQRFGNPDPWAGSIDDFKIWNTGLSASDIKAVASNNSSVRRENLVAEYNFNNDTATTVYDSSGNNNHGTKISISNPPSPPTAPTPAPPGGGSLTLSGNAYNDPWQYVVIEDSPSLSISGEYTVSSWVYRSNAGGDWRNLYDIPNAHLLEFSPGGRIRWRSENNNIDFRAGDPEIPEGEWHHVAATMVQNGSEYSASVYVDGQLATNTNDNNSNGVRDSNENLYLGILWSQRFGNPDPWAGSIDDFKIWNTGLSASEIKAVASNDYSVRRENLVAEYNFNNDTSTTVYDSSGYENHGTKVSITNVIDADPITGTLGLPGKVKLKKRGKVSFRLYGSEDLDVNSIEFDSIIFGRDPDALNEEVPSKDDYFQGAKRKKGKKKGSYIAKVKDLNDDGFDDIIMKVYRRDLVGVMERGDTEIYGFAQMGEESVLWSNVDTMFL